MSLTYLMTSSHITVYVTRFGYALFCALGGFELKKKVRKKQFRVSEILFSLKITNRFLLNIIGAVVIKCRILSNIHYIM
jgi:hypothetical protein